MVILVNELTPRALLLADIHREFTKILSYGNYLMNF